MSSIPLILWPQYRTDILCVRAEPELWDLMSPWRIHKLAFISLPELHAQAFKFKLKFEYSNFKLNADWQRSPHQTAQFAEATVFGQGDESSLRKTCQFGVRIRIGKVAVQIVGAAWIGSRRRQWRRSHGITQQIWGTLKDHYSGTESRVLRAQHTLAFDDGKNSLLSVFYDGQSKTREWLAECNPTLAATSLSAQRWGGTRINHFRK
ncbi:hypothetical protein C8J57DRAFT_1249118 [Mycena rebaudengoi]|nr:hypothetical protein C8J57DRAFT_1249118 [Mycena rebaudengoi]